MAGRYNYKRNSAMKQPEHGRMINGQGLGEVSRLRYGICRMSFNGCEVISVCNALTYLKKPVPIRDIARYMERYRMLFGFFGCSPFGIGRGLKHFGVSSVRVKKPADVSENSAFIISAWTGRPFLSTIHTVFCIRENSVVKVWNRYNKCDYVKEYPAVEKVFEGGKIITIYIVS